MSLRVFILSVFKNNNFKLHDLSSSIVILFCGLMLIISPKLTHAETPRNIITNNLDNNDISFSEWKSIPNGKARVLVFKNNLIGPDQQVVNYGLHVLLDPDWHTYWSNPGDSGAPPEIYLKSVNSEEQKIEIHYPYPERINVGPLVTYGYSRDLIYFFNVSDSEFSLRADLLVCKEECVPASLSFISSEKTLKLSGDENSDFKKYILNQLHSLPSSAVGQFVKGLSQIEWSFDLPKSAKIVDFFWTSESLNDLSLPTFLQTDSKAKFFTSAKSIGPNPIKSGLLVYELKSSTDNIANATPKYTSMFITFKEQPPQMILFFLMAFLGGLILNLMPCVFPIVSIKAFSVLKTSGQALSKIRMQNLAYSFGVIFCFILMGLTLSLLRSSGVYLGWGFQLQNPYVVLSLAFVFFILSLSFFDVWSWNWVPKFATHYYKEDSLSVSFLTGLLAVIVASPCTAPFMGAAIGFALTQSTYGIIIVFLGLGLGMSLPFLMMAAFPGISKWLPRPGAWMIYFKKVMGALLLATVVWLVWIFVQLVQPSQSVDLKNWKSLNVSDWSTVTEDLDQPRFVNFTADWCVTCKVNERLVFSQDSVQKFVNENQIQMYKVDWTKREDQIAIKLSEFGRVGVPLYLYFPKGSRSPVILPELLTPSGFISNLKTKP